jgi:hypothetical protein
MVKGGQIDAVDATFRLAVDASPSGLQVTHLCEPDAYHGGDTIDLPSNGFSLVCSHLSPATHCQ